MTLDVIVSPMRTCYVNIFMFVVPFKIHICKNISSTALPVDYITHGTHYPRNIIQIGTLKSLSLGGFTQIDPITSYLKIIFLS